MLATTPTMKHFSIFLFVFACISIANAQSFTYKKGLVTIDETECMQVSKSSGTHVFSDMDEDEVIYLKSFQEEGVWYSEVVFVASGKKMKSTYTFKPKGLIKSLLDTKVFDGCYLDESKIQNFILKYQR